MIINERSHTVYNTLLTWFKNNDPDPEEVCHVNTCHDSSPIKFNPTSEVDPDLAHNLHPENCAM